MTFSRWIDNLSRIIGFLYSNGDHLIENVFHSAFVENFQSKCSPKSMILKRDLFLSSGSLATSCTNKTRSPSFPRKKRVDTSITSIDGHASLRRVIETDCDREAQSRGYPYVSRGHGYSRDKFRSTKSDGSKS